MRWPTALLATLEGMDDTPFESGAETAAPDASAEQSAEQSAPPWVAGLEQAFSRRLSEIAERLPPPQQAPQEFDRGYEEPDPYDDELDYDDEYDDDDLDDDPSGFMEILDRYDGEMEHERRQEALRFVDRAVYERMQPFVDIATEQAFEQLQDEFTPLREDPQLREEVVTLTVERAREAGNEDLIRSPRFVRESYLLLKAEEQAARERPVEDSGAVLEQGGALGGHEAEPDDVFVQMARGKHREGFSGRLRWD
jgi:hypothetical protein